MALQRGDVVLLGRGKGGSNHLERAALIWRVTQDGVSFLAIVGVRSFDRSQKHRAELDLRLEEVTGMGLPIARPVLFCNHEHRLDMTRLQHCRTVGRASDDLMARATTLVAREVATRKMEDQLTFRRGAMPIVLEE